MTGKPHRRVRAPGRQVLSLLILCLFLPSLTAWAAASGDQVVAQCKANPFDKSQMTKAKVYAEPSIYSQTVAETCGERLTVLKSISGWVKVQDREKKFTGYLSEKDIAKVIPGPKAAAKPAPEPETAKPSRPSPPKPAPPLAQAPPAEPKASDDGQGGDNPFTQDHAGRMPAPPPSQPQPEAGKQAPAGKTREAAGVSSPSATAPSRQDSVFGRPAERPAPGRVQADKGDTPDKVAPPRAKEAVRSPASAQGCARIFLKMSQGKLLSQQEQNYLRRHCQ